MSSPERKKPTARAVRLFWMSALCIIVIFGLYRIIVQLVDNGKLGEVWFSVMMWAFMIAASTLFIAIVVLQRGFSGKPVSADELPDTMSIDEKRAYCESDARRKRAAKYLMMPFVAILFVFMFEVVEIYYLPAISGWFSSLSA